MKKAFLTMLIVVSIIIFGMDTASCISTFADEDTVTLNLKDGAVDISPTGYSQNGASEIPFTGTYIITCSQNCDTPLDLVNNSGSTVTYNVILDSATLEATQYATAVRFQGNSNIILNLTNTGTSSISTSNNHPVFRSYNSASVTVNVINSENSSLTLSRKTGTPRIFDTDSDTTVTINGEVVSEDLNNGSGNYSVPVHVHSYEQEVADENYLKSSATCNAKAIYYKSCSCGLSSEGTENEATFEYGEPDASNHTNLVKVEAKEATNLADGNVEYYYCDGCGGYFSDEEGTQEILFTDTVIDRLPEHAVDETGWHSDESSHWNTCECGEKLNEAAHTFETIIDKEPTATDAGYSHERCTVCGYEKALVEIPATGEATTETSEATTETSEATTETETSEATREETITPQTGDDGQPLIGILLFMAAGISLTGITIYRRCNR